MIQHQIFACNMLWTRQDDIEGTQVLTATGQMFGHEIQITPEGAVNASVWAETPGTRWEPGDIECVNEATFPTFAQAANWADGYDRRAAEIEAAVAADWDAEAAAYKAAVAAYVAAQG